MKIAVYGVGNVLRRDDGFGPSAVRHLEAHHDLPPEVVACDLGTPGLDLPSHLVGFDAVVFLDAAVAGDAPGTIRVYERDELMDTPAPAPHITGHEADLRASLTVAELSGDGPRDVWLVGVVPEDLGDGTGLTPAVRAALAPACERVIEILDRLGAHTARRASTSATGAWWEYESASGATVAGPAPPS